MTEEQQSDRWIAVQMAGELVAMLKNLPDKPTNIEQRQKIRTAINRLVGAADDPNWTPPWNERTSK